MTVVLHLGLLGLLFWDFARGAKGRPGREKAAFLLILFVAAALLLPVTLDWQFPSLADLLERLPLLLGE